MLGAIAGDIIGAPYEGAPIKTKDFPLFAEGAGFTDDSVCTVAVADALMNNRGFAEALRAWGRAHPDAGFGGMFSRWLMRDDAGPYGSWGNGAAMRVSPIAPVAADEADALDLAARAAAVSHDHPSAVTAAQAVVLTMWLARHGMDRAALRQTVADRFDYDLSPDVDAIRPDYGFDVSAAGTVPPALVCALEARDYEDAVRNAVSLGGDADTLACITGGVAEVLYGLPEAVGETARGRLTDDLCAVVDRFYSAGSAGA